MPTRSACLQKVDQSPQKLSKLLTIINPIAQDPEFKVDIAQSRILVVGIHENSSIIRIEGTGELPHELDVGIIQGAS